MKKNYRGLDVLRGLGIFVLLIMHTGFYHFAGLYDLDLNNPPLIVTLIGFLLMFAGIFAMISGVSHTLQYQRKRRQLGYDPKKLWKYNTRTAVYLLLVAYVYFIVTGPGIVDMANRTMNESILVHLINTRQFAGTNLTRVLYVDSLVMLGINVFLMGGIYLLMEKYFKKKIKAEYYLILAIGFMLISLVRIPLYPIYYDAFEARNWPVLLGLNFFVSKNNPIFPYLSFGLMGMWIGMLLGQKDPKKLKIILPVGLILFGIGILAYILLPDTMLERGIDPSWFAIMIAQLGLFALMVYGSLWYFDLRPNPKKPSKAIIFIERFGVAGLTVFFIESVVSALIAKILRVFVPTLSFDIFGALTYGLALALLWGIVLIAWEKTGYRYGIEYWIAKGLRKVGKSEKQEKLSGKSV